MENVKYFAGAHAGCLGYTPNHYPNHDHMLVKVSGESTLGDFYFQLREKKGIVVNGNWMEVEPTMQHEYDYDEGGRVYPAYLVSGARIPEEALVTKYEVCDVTDAIRGMLTYHETYAKPSPYFKKLELDKFRELDEDNAFDRGIITAVKGCMEQLA